MIEVGAVINNSFDVTRWHEPPGATGGSLPDSEDLWAFMWRTRNGLLGFAHVHPWAGEGVPSSTDVTTFHAIERALGRPLLWWVVTFTDVAVYMHNGDMTQPTYVRANLMPMPPDGFPWVVELRRRALRYDAPVGA